MTWMLAAEEGGSNVLRIPMFEFVIGLVAFFIVHIIMVLAAGPLNELRSMITGWYRASPGTPTVEGDKP